MKAKYDSIKEDNKNWWQAMNGPFGDEYWKDTCREIETSEGMEAWEVVDRTEETNFIMVFQFETISDE